MTEIYRDDMQTDVVSLNYDFESRTGQLNMGEGCCCDMSGCIALFKAIDPHVKRIWTFAGERRDTAYVKSGDGHWRAFLPPISEASK